MPDVADRSRGYGREWLSLILGREGEPQLKAADAAQRERPGCAASATHGKRHAPCAAKVEVARRRSFRVSPSPAAITNMTIRVLAHRSIDRCRQFFDLGRRERR